MFESARGPARRFELPAAEVRRFRERGYVAGIPLLSARDVDLLRERLERLRRDLRALEPRLYEVEAGHLERPGEVVQHFLGAWLVDSAFRALLFHPGVTRRLLPLLGTSALRFWHDQVFSKPPGHPGKVPWHQDYSYWTRTAPACHITMFIALDDMDERNGALHVAPGSHRFGLKPRVAFDGDMDAILESLDPRERAAFRPVPVPLAAGWCSIHHSHTIHGSFCNSSDRPRRAVVLNYMGPDVRVACDSAPLLRGVPRIPAGERVSGPFFPLVLRTNDGEEMPE